MFASRNNSGKYTWRGVEHPSVTKVLDQFGSDILRTWYAKMTAVECAETLQKGLDGILVKDEAISAVLDWQSRMTAPLRYRDHRGRIGTLTHHYLYERAIGVVITDDVLWMHDSIDQLGLAKHEGCGDGYATTLAQAAEPYIMASARWLDTYKPEFEMIGMEAMVVNETHGYAGRMDAIMRFRKDKWPLRETWLWDGPSVRLTGDFKTSKAISPTYGAQIEAYRNAEFIGLIEDESENQVEMTDGCAIIHIKPDTGAHILNYPPSPELFEAFCCMRYVYGVFENMPAPAKVKKIAKTLAGKGKVDKSVAPF